MKIFLDTNITVDILSNREPFCEASIACYEDAVQASCAKRHQAKYIITRNVKDYKLSPGMAIEPTDFLKLYGSKK